MLKPAALYILMDEEFRIFANTIKSLKTPTRLQISENTFVQRNLED
jgi:hypothetical protein